MAKPLVGIIMGSTSDWETMQHVAQTLEALGIPYEKRVISAHRTPKLMYDWGTSARDRGLKVVIAGAGGAAHLAGVAAADEPRHEVRDPHYGDTLFHFFQDHYFTALTTLMVFFSQAPAGLWAFPFHEDNLWIACGLYRDIM